MTLTDTIVAHLQACGPKTDPELRAIFGRHVNALLFSRRRSSKADVTTENGVWRWLPPDERGTRGTAKRRQMVEPGQAPWSRTPVNVAGPRTYVSTGDYVPPRAVIRPGSLDYQGLPSRVGDKRLPYAPPKGAM